MLDLVTVRARTRGRNGQEFTYQGIGRVSDRPVMSQDKDANGKVLPVKRADGTDIIIDDIDASGLTDNFNEVIDLYGQLSEDRRKGKSALQLATDGALNWYNVLARQDASPSVEVVTEDELTPIVNELIAAGLLMVESETTWRRSVTMGAKATEENRLEFVERTPAVKKLRKSQGK